ncbi:MAG: hypothetical protein KF832_15995 [Caldilineaceae bacterium]|nr:hypothetical protein [Caldilineaceae bacterium]
MSGKLAYFSGKISITLFTYWQRAQPLAAQPRGRSVGKIQSWLLVWPKGNATPLNLARYLLQQRARLALLSLIVASTLLLQLVHPLLAAPATVAAHAEPTDPTDYGLQCDQGFCRLQIKGAGMAVPSAVAAGAGLLFTFLQNQISFLPDGTGLQITDDITLQTPVGHWSLLGTDLIIQLAADNSIERLRGTAQIPWPSALAGAAGNGNGALALADLGLDLGKHLQHLQIPLAAEQSYFYLRLGVGIQPAAVSTPPQEKTSTLDTAVTRGQYLTLLFDPAQLDLWLDGNLTIALLNEWMFFNQLLRLQTGLPFSLASEAVNFHLSGLFSFDWQRSYLRLDGLYTLERQFIRNWFKSNASPLAVGGSLLINQEGLLLTGVTKSSILPDRLFDGEMYVEAFLPLQGHWGNAYIAAHSQATLPMVGVEHTSEQRLAAAPLVPWVDRAAAGVANTTNAVQPLFLVVKDRTTDAVVYAGRGYQQAQTAAGASYLWVVDTVVDSSMSAAAATQASFTSAKTFTTQSYEWTAAALATGATNTATFARDAYQWTANTTTHGAATLANATAAGYHATTDFASSSYAWTANTATQGATTVADTTTAGYHTTVDFASQSYHWAADTIAQGATTVANAATTGYSTTVELASDSYNRTADMVTQGATTVADTAGQGATTVGTAAVDGYTSFTEGVSNFFNWMLPGD